MAKIDDLRADLISKTAEFDALQKSYSLLITEWADLDTKKVYRSDFAYVHEAISQNLDNAEMTIRIKNELQSAGVCSIQFVNCWFPYVQQYLAEIDRGRIVWGDIHTAEQQIPALSSAIDKLKQDIKDLSKQTIDTTIAGAKATVAKALQDNAGWIVGGVVVIILGIVYIIVKFFKKKKPASA